MVDLVLGALRASLCVMVAFSGACMGKDFSWDVLGELYPEDFFKAPNIGQIALSPSGEKYIYTNASSGFFNFHLVDRETKEKKQYSGNKPMKDFINYIAWKDEERIVFQTQFGNIYLLDLKSNQQNLLFDAERTLVYFNAVFWTNTTIPRVLSLLPKDENGILISAYNSDGNRTVYRIDLKTKKSKQVLKSRKGINHWFADFDGNVRMGIDFSMKRVKFYYRTGVSDKFVSIDRFVKGDESLEIGLDKNVIAERKDYFLGFDFDPRFFYFASNRIRNTTTVYRFDTQLQTVADEIAYDEVYDFVDVTEYGAPFLASQKRRKWVGLFQQKEKPEIHWLDEYFVEIQGKVDRLLPGSSNLIYNWDFDEEVFLLQAIRSDRPTVFHLFDSTKEKLTQIGSMNDTLLDVKLKKMEPIDYVNREGMTIHGYLTLADKREDGSPAPLVMLIHGGPWIRDNYGYHPEVQWLAYNGYSVLQINYRGSAGYGFEHFSAARKDYGWGIQKDIEDARLWAIENGYALEDQIAIMGSSYGGYASMLAATTKPKAYRCIVAMSGIYDLAKETKNIKNKMKGSLPYESWKAMVGEYMKDKSQLLEISPVKRIDQLVRPVLLVHGVLDTVAIIDHARELKASLEENGKKHEYLEIESEGHSFQQPKNQAKVYGSVVDFLNTHFKD